MVRGDRRFIAGAVTACSLALALTACSGVSSRDVPGTYPDLSLATSKSPVQLLRNDAAGRIPTSAIDGVEDSDDVSQSCLTEGDDPEGLVRSWRSGAVVTIEPGSQWRVATIVDELAASYVEQGWTSRSLGGSANVKSYLLTSDKSMAEITVSAHIPDTDQTSISTDANVDNVIVGVQVVGPCVVTEGADSDEVKKVEGR
ncbi:MAG: hypothetical protein ACOH1J_03850 [Microbacteriaceae bacterium]